MKRTIVFLIISFFIVQQQCIVLVHADRMVRFIFNDGIPPTPSNECSAIDNLRIDPLFDITTNVRRYLRSIPSDVTAATSSLNETKYYNLIHDDTYDHRQLYYPARCKDNCAGYATGTCRATGCIGYRRKYNRALTTFENDQHQDQDHREAIVSCESQVAGIHAALDLMILTNLVTAPCKSYLTKSKRNATCFDDVIYGEILSFTFYNMNGNNARYPSRALPIKYKELVSNGFTICNNFPLNIEAVLNPCVKTVYFTMTGPNNFLYNRLDDNHPMLVFNTSTYSSTFGGSYLKPGTYFVKAVPDSFAYKEKNITFHVITC